MNVPYTCPDIIMSLRKNRMAMRSKAPMVALSMASDLECPEIRSGIGIISPRHCQRKQLMR